MSFMDQAGNVRPVRLDPDGSVPTSSDGGSGVDQSDLLARLIWETRELRRVLCDAHDQLFREYPG